MRRIPPAVARFLRRTFTGALAGALLLVGPGATGAWAHDSLAASTPAADAALPSPPAEVTLSFAEPPQALGTQVRVTGPDGSPATSGEPQVRGGTVVQPLADGLPAGRYTVEWRVTSADGHPISGTFSFTATAAAPAVVGGSGAAPSGEPDSSFPWVWVAMGGIVAVAGLLVARQLRRPA